MAEVDDWGDFAPLQFREGKVGKLPIIFTRSEVRLVDRRAIAEEVDADFLDAVEILAPPFIVAADLHLVDAGLAVIDGRVAVFNTRREHEVGDDLVSHGP